MGSVRLMKAMQIHKIEFKAGEASPLYCKVSLPMAGDWK